jgi:hypothetical protein
VLAILIAVIQWFNWDRYQDDAARWIATIAARPVSIDGPIDVKLFPSPHLYLAGISIGNPEGEFSGRFFHVQSAYASLNLTALFSGKLVLDELRLDRPRFQFEVDPAGHSNWQFNESTLTRLQSQTPAVIPRQLRITGGQLQFMNAQSNQSERVEVQDLFLELSADYTTSRIEALVRFHDVPIHVGGTLGDMSLWTEGNLEPISLQYSAGDMEGELSGKVADIFGERQVDLRYTARSDRFNTAGELLDLSLDFDLDAASFLFDAELQGNWQGISFTHAAGTIIGQGIQVDIRGRAHDLFRRNELDFDLRARSDSLNDLMATLGQNSLIEGTATMTAHLYGRFRGDLALTDVGIELETTAGLANAEGVVRGLSATARSENIGAEPQLSFEILTEDLSVFTAVVGYQLPIDGTGTAEGLLIRSDGHYRVENLSLTANAPELSLRATGTVDALGDEPRFKMQFEAHTEHLHDLLVAFDYQLPIDGTGTAEGLLIRSDGHYRVENLSLTANAPELSLRATGTVDALDSPPEFTLQVTGRSPDLAQLSQVWSWGWSFPAGMELEVNGSLKAVAGTVVISDLTFTALGQEVAGNFSGRLPSIGYAGRPDWLLDLSFDDLGGLVTGFGVPWIYPAPGEFTLRARPAETDTKSFHMQTGLNTKELDIKATGEVTGFDGQAGFQLAYSIVSPGAPKQAEWFGLALSRVGGFEVGGSATRIAGGGQAITGSARVVADRLGSVVARGVFGALPDGNSKIRVAIESESMAEVAALGSFVLADVGPFRGEAIIHLMPEQILLEEIHLRAGDNDLHGSITYRLAARHGGRAKVDGHLRSSYLNVNELLPPPKRKFLFGAEPLPVRWARTHDVEVGFKVGRFLRRNYDLRSLAGKVSSQSGIVDGQSSSFAFGGDLTLHLMLDTRSAPYRAKYQYDWKGLNLALLPAAQKFGREITGRMNLMGGVTGAGDSLHQIMEQGDGYLVVDFESARFLRGGMELLTTSPINIVVQILREVSPWVQRKKFFEIECGVIGMRIEKGIGRSLIPPDHTIAIKAKEFRLAGFGDVQFADESVGLSVRSKARRLGLSAATLIEQSGLSTIYSPFYRIAGTLLRPQVEPDPQGTDLLETGVRLGAAWATGGTSVFLLGLIDRLVIEPVGCEGARERALALVPALFP